jgi:hypothetical protein
MAVADKAPESKSLWQRAGMPALCVGVGGGVAVWLLTWGFLTYHGSEIGMSPSVAWPAAGIGAVIAAVVGFVYYARPR